MYIQGNLLFLTCMRVDKYLDSCYHHHNLDKEQFCHSSKIPPLLLFNQLLSLVLTPSNHKSVLHSYNFAISRMSRNQNHTVCNLLIGFFHLAQRVCVSSMLLYISIAGYFLLLYSTPLSRSTAISSSSHQEKGIHIGKHDFYYLNDITSYVYTKPCINSSIVSDSLSITLI